MALQFCLWVFCMSLLINGNAGVPTKKGYGYPNVPDSHNLLDDDDDDGDTMTSPAFDQPSNRQASGTSGLAYAGYNQPSAVGQPSQPNAERLVNGDARAWGIDKPDKPMFPVTPQNRQVDRPNPSAIHVLSTNSMPAAQNPGYVAGHVAYYEPAPPAPSGPASSGNVMPKPGSGSSKPYFNTGSSAGRVPHRVFEEVFYYPSGNTAPSQSANTVSTGAQWYGQANYEGASPALTLQKPAPNPSSGRVMIPSPVGAFGGGKLNQMESMLQKATGTSKVKVPQSVSQPAMSVPLPSSYIVQSRNGYMRDRYLMTQSRYTPEYPVSMKEATSVKSVKGTAKGPPADVKI